MKFTKKIISIILSVLLIFSFSAVKGSSSSGNFYVFGDADCNGVVSVADVTAIQEFIVGISEFDVVALSLSDVNSDNIVNVKDITCIQKYIAQISDYGRTGEICNELGYNTFAPSYWQDSIISAYRKVNGLRQGISDNISDFVWFSDVHSGKGTADIGKIVNQTMNICEVSHCVLSGDTGSQNAYVEERSMINEYNKIPDRLYPLWGGEKLLLQQGNHDGCYGNDKGKKLYYHKQWTPEQIYEFFFRPQAVYADRVFGGDGTYFYSDDYDQKTRYIMLNCFWGGEAQSVDENGGSVPNRFRTSYFGNSQLMWLADEALGTMKDDWSALVFCHAPVTDDAAYPSDKALARGIINAFINRTAFTGACSTSPYGFADGTVSVNFSSAKGEIIAVFSGHIHKDSVLITEPEASNYLACPQITITTSGGDIRDSYEYNKVVNTDTETAMDIVTIDKTARRIYLTRLGFGYDRVIDY